MGSVKTPKSLESENSYSEFPYENRISGFTGGTRSRQRYQRKRVHFAVISEVAFFAGVHLVEVLWADLLTL